MRTPYSALAHSHPKTMLDTDLYQSFWHLEIYLYRFNSGLSGQWKFNLLGSWQSEKDWFRHERMFSEKRKSHLIPAGPIHPAAAELALFVYLCLEKKFIRFSHFDPQWTRRRENCFYKYFFFEQSQIILYHLIWAENSEWFIKGFMGFCGYETFHHKIFWSSSLISFKGL